MKDIFKRKFTFEEGRRLVVGTFAIEGITLSAEAEKNLAVLASGEKSADEIIKDIKAEYSEKLK